MDLCDLSKWNLAKELEAIAVAYAHEQTDWRNTIQPIKIFKTLDGEDCVGAATVVLITIANKSISRLRNVKLSHDSITKETVGNYK